MENILVAIMQPDEWNQYVPFDGYIQQIKGAYDRVIGVVAENPMILLTSADEYYTIKNDLMQGLKYPEVLDTPNRTNDNFINTCVNRVIQDYQGNNLSFISWQQSNYHEGILHKLINSDAYRLAFKYAQQWYNRKQLIYPTQEAYDRVNKKFGHLFNENTFVLLTRNFKNKALIHNTNSIIMDFKEMVEHLTKHVNIINIGFPPVSCQINNNYHEINEQLTQDELVGLFYLAKGVLMQADSNGFLAHYASNIDSFIMTQQWTLNGEMPNFEIISYKTTDVDTVYIEPYIRTIHDPAKPNRFDEIVKLLLAHKPKRKLKFGGSKKITYVLP